MSKTFIIAEAGSSWQIGLRQSGRLAHAIKCIKVAKHCGADACKFQWTSQPTEMAKRRHMTNPGAYAHLAWPEKWLHILAAECEQESIEFMCTVFLPVDVETIAPLVKRLKVASLEAGSKTFCQVCVDTKKPVLISTGAAFMETFRDRHANLGWSSWGNVKVLHCIAAYPAPIEQMNLSCILRQGMHGLSDHSGDLLTGALAVAAGAEIIEVHFRLWNTPQANPDYKHSHDPHGLGDYIDNIRKAELMLGDGVKKVEDCERPMLKHLVTA